MPVWQTVLIYVVAPLGVALVLASLTLPGGRKRPRWKSGQPWPHEPVWYEPHPEALGQGGEHGGDHGDAHGAPALGAGHGAAAVGSGHGATAVGAGAGTKALTAGSEADAHPVNVGPLGGARGTW